MKIDRNHWYDEDMEDQEDSNLASFQKRSKKTKIVQKHKLDVIHQRRRQREKERQEQLELYKKEYN